MNRSFRDSSKPQNWEAEIKSWQTELKNHGHEMSPYERNVISREIRKRQDELIPVVGAQVIGEFKAAIKKYQDSKKAVDAAKEKEINRFDDQRYNAALQAIQSRVNLALKADVNPLAGDQPASARLKIIYEESFMSKDIHKQRAAAEVMRSIELPKNQDRAAVNELLRRAEKDESALRITEELAQAQDAQRQALYELGEKRDRLNKVSEILGTGSTHDVFSDNPFTKAARLVEFPKHLSDNDGTPAGEVVIYDENSPEVTGVSWAKI